MELKPGYKMTEVGVIPEDWEVSYVSDIIKELNSGVSVNSEKNNTNNVYILKTSAIHDGKLNLLEIKSVITKDLKKVKCHICKNSIVISRMNTPELVGACAYIHSTKNNIFLPDRLWQSTPTEIKTDFLWLTYLFNTKNYSKKIKGLATGTSNSMKNIAKDKFFNLAIPFPSFPEQQAIAAALSDVDELLSSLDRLIAKKKDIRLAAMQELLTGKTRLPGFQVSPAFQITEAGTIPDDWHVTLFGDIVTKIVGGGTPKRDTPEFWGGDIPWATVKDFATFSFDKTQEYITQKGVSASATHIIPAGTLIIATRMALGKTAVYKVNVAINQDLKAVIFNQDIDTNFIRYWFQWQEKNIQSLGSGSTVLGISTDLLKKISIAMPSLAEQQAIASVLSDMDAEIEALEARRDKVRHIKAGMMQELLTGKTRLISSGEEA